MFILTLTEFKNILLLRMYVFFKKTLGFSTRDFQGLIEQSCLNSRLKGLGETISKDLGPKQLLIFFIGTLIFSVNSAYAATGCSPYMGQVKINELRISSSGSSSVANRIELYNLQNVAPSVWQKWQLVVYYQRSGRTASKKGGYYLSNGFTANGQFIYNNNKSIYLVNRTSRYNDIALVDQNGNFIDYVALEKKVQTVPSCIGAPKVIDVTAGGAQGDAPRIPDGGNWPSAVTNSSLNTIGRTNVCTNSGSDLFVSNSVDNSALVVNPLVTVTPVTYTIDVRNVSCNNTISNITLTDTNISTTNFSNLSYSRTQGSSTQNPNTLFWNVGSLNAGSSASLIITGIPRAVGVLTTTASVTTPSSGLVNTADDSDSESVTVRDFNYVGFDLPNDQVSEGTDTSYSVVVGSMVVSSKPITINYSVTGTANSGDTTLSNSGSVVIDPSDPASPNEISIDFTIKNDTIYEVTKTITFTITSVSSTDAGVKLDGDADSMTITLKDDDSPSLIAEYEMDEIGWSGISGEVIDNSGYIHHGTASGDIGKASTEWSSPAKSGTSGTCAYGNFEGGSTRQSVDIGTVDLGLGGFSGVSVTAWVRWTIDPATGNPSASIVSNNGNSPDTGQIWLQHNATNSKFQFAVKTTNGRNSVESITRPQINVWYHLAGVYDGNQLAIYVNGTLEATANLTGGVTPFNSYPFSIGRWGNSNSNYRAFQGNIDEVKIFNGPITPLQINDIYNEIHVCPIYSNGNYPGNFNCVEVGAPPTSNLYTKLAGSAFNLDVLALTADGNIETGYVDTTVKNVTVELVDGSGATACAERSLLPGLTKTLSMATNDKGRKSISFGPINYAYPNVRCRVTDANQNASIIGCSSDNFTIRPSNLTVSSTANADANGQSATSSPSIKTHATFSMGVISDSLGYNGTPKLDSSKLTAHNGALQNGLLAGSFDSADSATGIANGSSFKYSEVGYFKLGPQAVYDDNFTSIDSIEGDCTTDFSNTSVSGKVGCKFGNINQTDFFGRFIPDHLIAQVLSNGAFAHACSTFTYNGQPLYYATYNHPMLDISAYNAASPAIVTKNYTGKFARLQASQFNLIAPINDALQLGLDNNNPLKVSSVLGSPSLVDNNSGNLTLILGNDKFTYLRESNSMIAPFSNKLAIGVSSVTDNDDITATNLPLYIQPAGENIRYGRISLMNANGSELHDLTMTMLAEHYNGNSFVTNIDDHCSVATLNISDNSTTDNLQIADTCIWDTNNLSGGNKCLTDSPIGESYLEGSGLVAGNFNVFLKAPNKIGSLKITANLDSWMKFNWLNGGESNPIAIASFGIYKGRDKVIYFREVY